MKTAFVVRDGGQSTILNHCFAEGHRAYFIGQAHIGQRYDRIVLLTELVSKRDKDWFISFRTCLAPNGVVLLESTGKWVEPVSAGS